MQNTFASLAPQAVRKNFWLILALFMLVTVTSCIIDDGGNPEIISMTVSPSQVSRSETGTSNEFFTVTLEIANFDGGITEAEVYIVKPHRIAVPGKVEVEGNIIILSEIAKTWFGDLDPGIYKIGALVKSETVPEHRQNDLTTVTVTE